MERVIIPLGWAFFTIICLALTLVLCATAVYISGRILRRVDRWLERYYVKRRDRGARLAVRATILLLKIRHPRTPKRRITRHIRRWRSWRETGRRYL